MLSPLRLEVAPFSLAEIPDISQDLLKKYCRVDFDDDDDLFDVFAAAAVNWCENATLRTVFERPHSWVLRSFNCVPPYAIRLPRGKAQSVESVSYSSGGALTTLKGPSSSPVGTEYQENLLGDWGGILMPSRGSSWPTVDRDVPAPITINFTAGWPAAEVPADLLHAIMFAIADLYDGRGSLGDLANGGDRRLARTLLISGYRLTPI